MIVQCPYCLNMVSPSLKVEGNSEIYKCSKCYRIIHRDYIEKDWPRGSIGLVGFSGHGKTCYLTSLFYLLRYIRGSNILGKEIIWNTLNKNTRMIVYDHVSNFEKKSELPPGTPENFPEPALLEFQSIPFFQNFFLSFYDTNGGNFEDEDKITEKAKYVAYCDVVLFIISIKDCENTTNEMENLLEIYISAVYNNLRIDLKKNQHLIVVLTKADEIATELSDELRDFLQAGSYEWYRSNHFMDKDKALKNKVKKLMNMSEIIETWLRNSKNGSGFTALARRSFKSVEYTIVSSLGAEPGKNGLATKPKPDDPKRVLDPFFLALEKIRPKGLLEKIKIFR